MSTESLDGKEETGVNALLKFCYNKRTGEVLGRNGSSWAKVGFFYLVFYACLALFWAGMLKLFMATIDYEKPKWSMEESLIGLSPGLSYRPAARLEKIDSTLIHFRPGVNASYHHWAKDIEQFLKPYQEAYNTRSDCRSIPTRNCPFAVNVADNICGPNFGYDTGSPCVLIKLNRVFNWKPNTYKSLDDIRNGLTKYVNHKPIEPTVKNRDLTSGEGLIAIQCEGENSLDREKLGAIEYWPRQGFPAEYYPYTNQKDYLAPFVLVKFNRITKNTVVNIECTAFDKNIKINRYDREGSVKFELLVDE